LIAIGVSKSSGGLGGLTNPNDLAVKSNSDTKDLCRWLTDVVFAADDDPNSGNKGYQTPVGIHGQRNRSGNRRIGIRIYGAGLGLSSHEEAGFWAEVGLGERKLILSRSWSSRRNALGHNAALLLRAA
jgi:hypothetical protein